MIRRLEKRNIVHLFIGSTRFYIQRVIRVLFGLAEVVQLSRGSHLPLQVVLRHDLHVRSFLRHLLRDLRLRGRCDGRKRAEHSLRSGKQRVVHLQMCVHRTNETVTLVKNMLIFKCAR